MTVKTTLVIFGLLSILAMLIVVDTQHSKRERAKQRVAAKLEQQQADRDAELERVNQEKKKLKEQLLKKQKIQKEKYEREAETLVRSYMSKLEKIFRRSHYPRTGRDGWDNYSSLDWGNSLWLDNDGKDDSLAVDSWEVLDVYVRWTEGHRSRHTVEWLGVRRGDWFPGSWYIYVTVRIKHRPNLPNIGVYDWNCKPDQNGELRIRSRSMNHKYD